MVKLLIRKWFVIINHARKIKASKGKHYRWKVPFLKTNKMIHCESSIERDYVKLVDYDSNILDIIHQPLVITYRYKNRTRRYYPDFKVLTRDGRIWIVEIKPDAKINKPDNAIKFLVGQLYCQKMGWEYHIVTDKLIREGYLQRNLSFIRALGNQPVEFKYLQNVLQTLKNSGECSIEMLRENCIELQEDEFYKALYKLLYHKKIFVDLIDTDLNDNSYISITSEEED